MNIYHLIYEPSFKSLTFHHWAVCNLTCKGCFCQVEKLDFSLFDDALEKVKSAPAEKEPTRFIGSLEELQSIIGDLDVQRAVYIGIEPTLDPDFAVISRFMKEKYDAYNVLITNGVKMADLSCVDEVVFSIKAVTDSIYKDYAGRSNIQTLKNFKTIYDMGKKLQAECLYIPALIEDDEVEKIARFIANIDKNITLRIDGYFEISGQPWRSSTTQEVAAAAEKARRHLTTVNYLSSDTPSLGEKPLRLFG